MSTIKRFIKRNSHNGFTKVLAGFGRSLHRFYENRNHDIHSNGELMVLKKLASFNPSVIIDGGANTGDYALMVHQFNSNSLIYAFEPVEATFEILSTKTSAIKNIIPLNKGLYKEECTKSINLFDSNRHSSIYDIEGLPYKSKNQTSISLLKGDDFLKEYHIARYYTLFCKRLIMSN